jgi:hypothetical protein
MNNPYRDIEELDDAIHTELESRGHDVWLSQALADFLSTDDEVDFRLTLRRHLDHALLPQEDPGDEA